MPNWCSNSMVVTGDPEQVGIFVEQMISDSKKGDMTDLSVLDFGAVVPMPPLLMERKSPSDDGSITWYDWSIENWGTKWNACDAHMEEYKKGDKQAFYNYETAWGPAMAWQEKVIEYFPWLRFDFEWEELGMNFCGSMTGADGKVGEVVEGEIPKDRYEEVFGDE